MLSVTDFVPKESFPGSEFKPGLYLDMLDADRSPNAVSARNHFRGQSSSRASIWTCWMLIDRQMQSAPFMPELHSWISKLTARHLQGPPGDLLITKVKETVILYKKRVSKMKKSRISHWSERDENAKWREIASDCVKRANVVLHVGLCKEIFARKHTATHKPTSARSPPLVTSMTHTHTHTHTPNNRPWSPLAYGLGAPQAINVCMYVCHAGHYERLRGAEQMSACG